MKKLILSIEGMTCSACSSGLEKYLNKQNGIYNASVNLVLATATIQYNEKLLNIEKIENFIKTAGFKSLGEFKEIKIETKAKKEKYKFIIFSLLAFITMYISMSHMFNLPIPYLLNPHINPINYIFVLLLITICFIIYGFDILKNGYKNLIHKTPNMDTLVALGVVTSILYSLYNTYLALTTVPSLVTALYFESATMVIYFIKLGRYIDTINKDKTKEAIQKLVKITPNTAVVKTNGVEKIVTLDEIQKGDIVISKAGEKIAVDGKIIFGTAHLDESFITGESKPVLKEKESYVLAGSMNYDGYIEYEAERIGKETTVSEIVKIVLESANTKPKLAHIADIVSSYFVPIVILIAILTFIIYLILGHSFSSAITTFVTILVIACPCSLGLATPLAIVVSEGECATNGILIKKSEILENAPKIDTIVFDKTGTLTYGKPKIYQIINYTNLKKDKLLQIVGSIENKSHHPISKAFTDYLEENKIEILKVNSFGNIAGLGIVGTIDKKEYLIGNAKLLKKNNIINSHIDDEKKLSKKGNSIIYVVEENKIIALIGVNDIVREEAKEVITKLTKRKIDTVMLTGDNNETANMIAKDLGITSVISNVLPQDKSNVIKQLKQQNKFIMMCGDGINDAPALKNADIGLSINSASDIALDSSDVILTSNNLNGIIDLINISNKTINIIKQNLFWAFFYNCLMIIVATGILKPLGISVTPMTASIAMVLSSVTVVLNALRLKKQ